MCNHSRSVEVSTAPSQRGARNPFPLPVQERQVHQGVTGCKQAATDDGPGEDPRGPDEGPQEAAGPTDGSLTPIKESVRLRDQAGEKLGFVQSNGGTWKGDCQQCGGGATATPPATCASAGVPIGMAMPCTSTPMSMCRRGTPPTPAVRGSRSAPWKPARTPCREPVDRRSGPRGRVRGWRGWRRRYWPISRGSSVPARVPRGCGRRPRPRRRSGDSCVPVP